MLLVLAALVLRYRKQHISAAMMTIMAVLMYAVSTPLVGSAALQPLESRYAPPAVIDGDVYVMLTGGSVQGTPEPSGIGSPGVYTLSRIAAVAELYAKKPLPILISGGQVYEDSGNEGRLSMRVLTALGVPAKDIVLEDQSRTTQENARYSKALLEKNGYKKPILVTSAFHMPRAMKHFRAQQVEAIPYPVGYLNSRNTGWSARQLLPSSSALDWLSTALKEYIGMLQ
ncbi:YdcF family protein [Paenibacillus solanacearum]|nr:YdcF family protein [Paenibacillus solanacearum]